MQPFKGTESGLPTVNIFPANNERFTDLTDTSIPMGLLLYHKGGKMPKGV